MGGHTGFLIAAVLVGIVGFFFLSNVTSGVGLICTGVLLAIIARVRQAEHHHFEVTRLMLSIKQQRD